MLVLHQYKGEDDPAAGTLWKLVMGHPTSDQRAAEFANGWYSPTEGFAKSPSDDGMTSAGKRFRAEWLFELVADPNEKTNRVEDSPEVVARLKKVISRGRKPPQQQWWQEGKGEVVGSVLPPLGPDAHWGPWKGQGAGGDGEEL